MLQMKCDRAGLFYFLSNFLLSLPNEGFLEAIGAAKYADDGKLHPTCAGLLMFGKEYKILYEYDQYFLDYREHLLPDVRWTDRIQSQSGDWSGNLFDFFSRVSPKLVLDLKKPFQLVDMVRIDETPIHDAVREALVNCLVNSDFYEPRGVVIEKYPDRIEFRNPGISIVGKKQMLRGGESEPRNSSIMKMFNLIGYGERAGSGVPDIYSVWNHAGYVEPSIEEQFGDEQPNRTLITLPLMKKEALDISEKSPEKSPENVATKSDVIQQRMDNALAIIRENPSITMVQLRKELDLSESKIKTAIKKLKESGKIHRSGSDTKGEWIVD